MASADWDSFQPQRTAINPGAVKLGRTPSTTSRSYLSTFQWNQLLLQKAPAPTLYVLFLQTKRVWLWKESQPWSRKPSWAAPAGCKIYLKSVTMETIGVWELPERYTWILLLLLFTALCLLLVIVNSVVHGATRRNVFNVNLLTPCFYSFIYFTMCLLQDITAVNKLRHFSFFWKKFKHLNSCKTHSMLTSQNFLIFILFHCENDLETGKCKRKCLSTKVV